MPEMRRVTVRFGESLWDLIEDEANLDGVSAAQWIRDAALICALWERQRRGVDIGPDALLIVRQEHQADDESLQRVVRDVLERARPELDSIIAKVPPASAAWLRELYKLD